ncbi:MAG: hypothetical protein EAZ99_03385 [Alphaproteobacteria bacterium]|nr:MAG: hypothetical protein EAZ99_03385 [Alphaproteobacteria bacterium]
MMRVFVTLFGLVGLTIAGVYIVLFIQQYRYENFTGPDVRPAYVELEPIHIPILRGGVPIETRTYVLVVETGLGQDAGIRAQELRLRDAFVSQMNMLVTRRAPENLDNIDFVRAELKRVSEPVVGVGIVRQVLVRTMTRQANPNA